MSFGNVATSVQVENKRRGVRRSHQQNVKSLVASVTDKLPTKLHSPAGKLQL